MRINWFVAVVLVVCGIRSVRADDIRFTSSAEIAAVLEEQSEAIEQLRAEVASLKTEGATVSQGGGNCDCSPACNPCGCCSGRSSGFYGGAELTFLKPHNSSGIRGPLPFGTDLEYDYETAPRIWAGWSGTDGFGIRARYWECGIL